MEIFFSHLMMMTQVGKILSWTTNVRSSSSNVKNTEKIRVNKNKFGSIDRNQLKVYNSKFSQKPPQPDGIKKGGIKIEESVIFMESADQGKRNIEPQPDGIKKGGIKIEESVLFTEPADQGKRNMEPQLDGIKKGGIKIEESILFMEPADQGKRNIDKKSDKRKVKESPPQKKPKDEVKEEEKKEQQKKPEKKKDIKKQPVPSNDDSSDEGEKTMKRAPKKKEPEVKDDDDDDFENPKTIKRSHKKKVAPEITLTQIDQKNVFTDFTFNQTFPINRQSKVSYGISLHPDKEVSMNHSIVHCIEDSGFFLQDVGSSNLTFIKLKEKSNVTLKEGFKILMGESIFEVITLSPKKIKLHVTIDFEADNPKQIDIELKFSNDSDEIVFGKNPSAANIFSFTKDKEIDDEHALFKKFPHDRYLFCPLKTVNK